MMNSHDDRRRNARPENGQRSRSSSRGRTGASKRATTAILQNANKTTTGEKGFVATGSNAAEASKVSSPTEARSRSPREQRGVSRNISASSSSRSRSQPRRARSMRSLGVGTNTNQTPDPPHYSTQEGGEEQNRSLSRSRHSSGNSTPRSRQPPPRHLPARSQSFSVRPAVHRSHSSSVPHPARSSMVREPPPRTKSAHKGYSSSTDLNDASLDSDLTARRQRMKDLYRKKPSWDRSGHNPPTLAPAPEERGQTNRPMQLLRGSSHRHMRGSSWVDNGPATSVAAARQDHSLSSDGNNGNKEEVDEEVYLRQRQSRQDIILEIARKEKWEAQERKIAQNGNDKSAFDDDSDDSSDEVGLKVKKKRGAFGKVKKAVKTTAKKTAKTSKSIAKNSLDVAMVVGSTTIDGAGKVVQKSTHLIMNQKKDKDDAEEYADYNPSKLASRQRSSSLLDRVILTGPTSAFSSTENLLRRDSVHSIALDSVDEEDLVSDEYEDDEHDDSE